LLKLRQIALSEGPVLADQRWAAYQPTANSTVIIDSRSERDTRRTNPSGCQLQALGGDELLYSCVATSCVSASCEDGWSTRLIIENAATGALSEVDRLPFRGRGNPAPVVMAVGNEWLELGEFEYKITGRYFIDWRTGEMREPVEAKDTYVDLDGTQPMKRYCASVSRPTDSVGGPAPHEFGGFGPEVAFDFPFAIEHVYAKDGLIAVLRPCGTNHVQRLPGVESREPSIIAGIAWWGRFVTRLRTTGAHWHGPIYRLKTYPSPRFPSPESEASSHVVNTATTIYAYRPLPVSLQPPGFRGATREAVYAGRMP
jgi:hypothetical protein